MMHSVELKKTSIQRLKKDVESMEKDTISKLAEIDSTNTQITVSLSIVWTFTKQKILDWSKLKAFADNKMNVTEKLKFV